MKNKGFTLVELLAVIAILAILVIVAMPNVLGMFNQAKVNSFVTEVQKIMDTATTTFTKDALLNSGKTVYYSSTENATLDTKKLDMSGNEKNYFIEMDRNGKFKRVVVFDSNYCYDIYSLGTNGKLNGSKSKLIIDKISKTSVVVEDVWESGNDSVGITMNGTNYVVSGCEGVITTNGKDTNIVLDTVKIDGVEYSYIPGMTWEEWYYSEYNTIDNLSISNRLYMSVPGSVGKTLRYSTYFNSPGSYFSADVEVEGNDEIIKNEEYDFVSLRFPIAEWEKNPGDLYYDENEPIKYNMTKKVW